jgi:hypothetical protein
VYDGLGNPVGRLSGIFDDIGKAVGSVVSAIPQAVASIPQALSHLPGGGPLGLLSPLASGGPLGLLGRMFGGGTPAPGVAPLPAPAPTFASPLATAPGWPMPFIRPQVGLPAPQYWRPPTPWPRPTPWPAGWVHPQLPYTGLGPKRLYMRRLAGPKGTRSQFCRVNSGTGAGCRDPAGGSTGRRCDNGTTSLSPSPSPLNPC